MSKIWVSSDYHHQHNKICEYTDRKLVTCSDYHTEWLVNLHNKQVERGHTVYILGDVSFSTKPEEIAKFMRRLNGQKIIIKGNHDDRKTLNKLVEVGAITAWYEYKEIKLGGIPTVLFHFPIRSWHRQGYGAIHLFGHSHGSSPDTGGKSLDVGLDSVYNIFGEHRLLSEDDVLEYMKNRPVKVEDLHKDRTKE